MHNDHCCEIYPIFIRAYRRFVCYMDKYINIYIFFKCNAYNDICKQIVHSAISQQAIAADALHIHILLRLDTIIMNIDCSMMVYDVPALRNAIERLLGWYKRFVRYDKHNYCDSPHSGEGDDNNTEKKQQRKMASCQPTVCRRNYVHVISTMIRMNEQIRSHSNEPLEPLVHNALNFNTNWSCILRHFPNIDWCQDLFSNTHIIWFSSQGCHADFIHPTTLQ